MILPALAVVVALVVQDQAPLRSAPHENAPRQTTLAPGEWLEIRGERQGYLQVYDHRLERPGYVRPTAVRRYAVDETSAGPLGALVEYLRDAPGQESLGIGYVALYLRAAPPQAVGAEEFDALGTMAERLADRASARVAAAGDASLPAELEVAESYGVRFIRYEDEARTRVCYDGEAFRRVLALGGSGPARVRAALGLTDPACVDPALHPTEALALAKWQASVLDGVDPAKLGPDADAREAARLRLRRSIVQSALAYLAARTGDEALAARSGEAAKRELMLADRAALADEDRLAYEEAALHTAAVRWANEPAAPSASPDLDVEIAQGSPGQTCVRVRKHAAQPATPLVEHCTYGVVWPSSIRVAPHDAAVTLIVEPVAGWDELLLLHPTAAGWSAETIAPATVDPELGYVEPAGFSPDGAHLLIVREWRASGPLGSPHTASPRVKKLFQLVTTEGARIEKESATLATLPSFRRWVTAEWQRGTLALR
jgi:hypothetical protein